MTNPAFILFRESDVSKTVKDDANILKGNPEMAVWLHSNDQVNGVRTGIWECTAGDHRAKMDGYIEICHILEGEAEITTLSDGTKRTVHAGDSFMMEAGLEMDWHVPKYIRKVFVITDVATSTK